MLQGRRRRGCRRVVGILACQLPVLVVKDRRRNLLGELGVHELWGEQPHENIACADNQH